MGVKILGQIRGRFAELKNLGNSVLERPISERDRFTHRVQNANNRQGIFKPFK